MVLKRGSTGNFTFKAILLLLVSLIQQGSYTSHLQTSVTFRLLLKPLERQLNFNTEVRQNTPKYNIQIILETVSQ